MSARASARRRHVYVCTIARHQAVWICTCVSVGVARRVKAALQKKKKVRGPACMTYESAWRTPTVLVLQELNLLNVHVSLSAKQAVLNLNLYKARETQKQSR